MAGVVAVGGGHGLAQALAALRSLGATPTAVVTVADDGGSSGRLRRELGIIPPGDLRMALVTLARNRPLAELLAHRFTAGELAGHALGNLVLVALADRAGGDFLTALDGAGALLDCAGRVLPATLAPVQLKAVVAGVQVDGQVQVAAAGGRVERLWLEPGDPPACAQAVEAIHGADLIVLGPGSLFTSVIATLLVPELADALAKAPGRVVLVANLATQVRETEGMDLGAHVAALLDVVPGLVLDAVVVHEGPVPQGPGRPLGTALSDPRAGATVRADLAMRRTDGAAIAVHDADRLATALASLVDQAGTSMSGTAASGAGA